MIRGFSFVWSILSLTFGWIDGAVVPTGQPSSVPSTYPSGKPSYQPTQPSGQPSGYPTQLPTDFLQTEVGFVASHWVNGVASPIDFKLYYRDLFEQAISESINPAHGKINAGQTIVQVVTSVSAGSPMEFLFSASRAAVKVKYKVTLIMERHGYNTTNRTFQLLSQDLLHATESDDLQRRLNDSVAMTFGSTVPGVEVSNFQAVWSDMRVNYLKTYWPTSMPTSPPYDGPRKKHSVAITLGTIVLGGVALMLLTYFLDKNIREMEKEARVSPSPHHSSSDVNDARMIIRTAIPFLEAPENFSDKIERFHSLSFEESAFIPIRLIATTLGGLLNGDIWKHHRWVGALVHLRYIPRYVRVFCIISYASFMLLFSLFWIRDLYQGQLPPGFRLLNWDFNHAIIVGMCACSLVSSFVYTIIEGWYYTIIASYTRLPPSKSKKGQNSLANGSESPSRRRAAAPMMNSAPSQSPGPQGIGGAMGSKSPELRAPALSPPMSSIAESRSRRISVRSAAMSGGSSMKMGPLTSTPPSIVSKRGSVSGPLNIVVSRRNNIRPIGNKASGENSDPGGRSSFAPVPERFTKISVPVSRSGVHNVTRLQEEILYCRGTLITGDKPKSAASNNVRERRASSAHTNLVTSVGLKRCNQFDCIWGLNKFGRVSESRPTSTILNMLFGRNKSSFQLIVADLFSVHRAAGIELRKMQRPSMKLDQAFNEEEHLQRNRRRIVQLFQLDVLPPMDRAIVYNQIVRHERLTEPVTLDRRVKIVGQIQILVVFLAAIFIVFWYSRAVSEQRQTSVVILFIFWLGLDFLVVSTLSTLLKHIVLPHLATDEVFRVASWLHKTLDQLFGSISAGGADSHHAEPTNHKIGHSAGEKQKELFKKMQANIAGDINTSNMPSFVSLNAAHHFFLSSRIASLFPISFPEVKAIYSFHSLWPKRNMDVLYNQEVEAVKKMANAQDSGTERINMVHSEGAVNFNSSASARSNEKIVPPAQWMWYPKLFPYMLVYYFLNLPLRLQDVCIEMISWGITLGTIYLHAYLYHVQPFLTLLPFPGLLLLLSLCYTTGLFRDAKLRNYPRNSSDVGLWVMENKEQGEDVGLETLYVHDALREQKKLNEFGDEENENVAKSDFLASLAAARDIDKDDDDDSEGGEGKQGMTAEEIEASKKEKMMRSLEAEIAARARTKRGGNSPSSSPLRGGAVGAGGSRLDPLHSLRPTPLTIKSPNNYKR